MKITKRQLLRIIREEKTKILEGYLDKGAPGSTRSQYRIFKFGDDGYIYEKLESQLEGYVAEKMRKEGTGLDEQDFEALEVAMTDALYRLKRRFQ
jgi:hypothetical protein